jgi:hypothetical protein
MFTVVSLVEVRSGPDIAQPGVAAVAPGALVLGYGENGLFEDVTTNDGTKGRALWSAFTVMPRQDWPEGLSDMFDDVRKIRALLVTALCGTKP